MLLDLATFMTLATSCAPTVAPTTLLAVARAESGLDPLAIGVNAPTTPRVPATSTATAVREARRLIAAGRDIDLGLAQINVRNLSGLGLTVADAFDPCRNLAASARVLSEGYRRALPASGPGQPALRTALSYYNTGSPDRGFRNGYVARVLAHAGATVPERALAAVDAEPSTPIASWDVFGRARLTPAAFVLRPTLGAQP
ncbi:MAG: lytic transglycosylase domain-containing protein [Alphaproteobacteria bacterium]|nr:lytic transglycosylase domain-containing protein [Alphaproteobacteria bacterium]MBU1516584.1 lytic transglycosylase domain-containing protein [Alphaproteobacteria bacterium]MBU2094341.1 lytic transglycosylase domain-containing protein [Alphaproteobacteria bacterium]MBU2153225.1 lytic transglycosylase domain-containing protein [Alphaproteobacteria bacterium]MBU2307511.1 lytic transglycosylase domain-containing protein [Alphaproteobacteria bacterium]